MKMLKFNIIVLAASLLTTLVVQETALSQRSSSTTLSPEERRQQEDYERLRQRADSLPTAMNPSNTTFTRLRKPRKYPTKEPDYTITPEELADLNRKLKPDSEDLQKYANFLKDSKTGIVRLFPDLKCATDKIVNVNTPECENSILLPGNGSHFSFSNNSYERFSQIHFLDGCLFADESNRSNMIGAIIELKTLTIESWNRSLDQFKTIKKLRLSTEKAALEQQKKLIAQGLEQRGSTLVNKIQPKLNEDYLLRSTRFRSKAMAEKFPNIKPEDTDLTLIFRVIRRDEDGSITLIWRELSRDYMPQTVD